LLQRPPTQLNRRIEELLHRWQPRADRRLASTSTATSPRVARSAVSELCSSLWKSCLELRGGTDASHHTSYVLALLFVNYVSEKYTSGLNAVIDIAAGGTFRLHRSAKPKFRQAPSEFVLAWRGLGVISGFRVLPTT
jgi:hypothetical protein